MSNIRTELTALVVAILFVSSIAGTIFYYNGKVNISNSKIASLNNQVINQNSEIADLTSQITHFNSEVANLSTYLEVSEVINGTSPSQPVLFNGALAYDALSINGTVVNIGNLTAYNAGLKVVAYSASGTLEINMTVPLVHGGAFYMGSDPYYGDVVDFGTDNATQSLASELDGYIGSSDSLKLGDLGGGQTVPVNINIIHEGIVTKWTVTPVWTNAS